MTSIYAIRGLRARPQRIFLPPDHPTVRKLQTDYAAWHQEVFGLPPTIRQMRRRFPWLSRTTAWRRIRRATQ